jgi:hypothetical protein
MLKKYLAVALCGIFTGQVNATTVYDDGAVHTIDSFIHDDIYLENESDLNIEGKGIILSGTANPAISSPAWLDGHEVHLSDGALVLGSVMLGGDADERNQVILNDRSRIFGMGAYSATSTVGRPGVSGAGLVAVYDKASIRGSYHSEKGGSAIDVGDTGAFRTSVNGGRVIGGGSGQIGGAGINAYTEVLEINQTNGVIKGGRGGVRGGNGIDSYDLVNGFIHGGKIIGGSGGEYGGKGIRSSDMNLEITDGTIRGGDGGEYGGDAIYAHIESTSSSLISGGSFNAGNGAISDGAIVELWGSMAKFTITGGQFGYQTVGNGFIIHGSTVEVHGRELTFNDGILKGYLLDGNQIKVPVSTFGDATLSIINY